ncbi:hypothetical protein BHE74_00015107 [Ensete ventricosum]|nr:hypothetical protein GW17_00007597 [Ensete ventricosum]RWW76778.1 hypothetical protein BHE74_00015107 [Ensete ventricosum]RZR78684.1 hypothetical protein BHM03_00004105 [Ensete ventricosum]
MRQRISTKPSEENEQNSSSVSRPQKRNTTPLNGVGETAELEVNPAYTPKVGSDRGFTARADSDAPTSCGGWARETWRNVIGWRTRNGTCGEGDVDEV